MNARTLLSLGAMMGLLGVLAGTFGAHAMGPELPLKSQQVFETGVRYHMYHALATVLAGCVADRRGFRSLSVAAGGFFLVGTVLFSGSLYLLAITGARWLGMIAPIGGVAFLAGWLMLFSVAVKQTSSAVSHH